jgi:hypothetical protein
MGDKQTKHINKSFKLLKKVLKEMSTLLFLVLLISATSLACQHDNRSHLVSRNDHSDDPLKFHLHDEENNHYLWLEPNTMMLRSVTAAEFEASKRDHMTWFTACNNFIPASDSQNFEVCMAGIENHRLYYDEQNKIFSFLPTSQRINSHFPMSMNLISNKVTGRFEKSMMMCSKGNLIFDRRQVKIEANQSPTILRVGQ